MTKMWPSDSSPCINKVSFLPLIYHFLPLFFSCFFPKFLKTPAVIIYRVVCFCCGWQLLLLLIWSSYTLDQSASGSPPTKGRCHLSCIHVSSRVTRAALWHCHRTYWWQCLQVFACLFTSVCGSKVNPQKPCLLTNGFWNYFATAQTRRQCELLTDLRNVEACSVSEHLPFRALSYTTVHMPFAYVDVAKGRNVRTAYCVLPTAWALLAMNGMHEFRCW